MSSARGRRRAGSAADSGQEYTSDPQNTSGGQEYTSSGQQYSATEPGYQQTGQSSGSYQPVSGGETYQQSQRGGGTATYQQQPAGYERGGREAGYAADEEGRRRTAKLGARVAGFLMVVSGIYGFLVGISAILRGAFFHANSTYLYHWGIRGWGVTELVLGCVLVAAGFCLILGMLWARIVGIVIAAFNAISAFMFLPWFPLGSIILVAFNLFIIWAIAHYHQRSEVV